MSEHPSPGPDRIEAAFEPMRVAEIAEGLYEVEPVDGEDVYRVDVDLGACLCPDFEYRSEEIGACKHIIRVRAVHEAKQLPDVGVELESGSDLVDGVHPA